MVKSNENALIFTQEKRLEQQGESYEFLMNFMATILWLGERGFLVTIINKWDYNVHVFIQRFAPYKCKLLLLLLCMMKQELIRNPHFWKNDFFFTQTEYHLFTSITPKVVWPLSEPRCVKTRGGASPYSQRMQRISRWMAFACYHGHSIRKRSHLESTIQANDRQMLCDVYTRTFHPYFCKSWWKRRWSMFICNGQRPITNQSGHRLVLEYIEGSFHEILPRSTDLNPMENIFHLVKCYLDQQAISRNIVRKSLDEFTV